MNPLDAVTAAVDDLTQALPNLLDACTDPQATDLAELFYEIQAARIALLDLERQVEDVLARALPDDMVTTPTLRVERRKSRDRKQWDHDAWQRDVRAQVLRTSGLLGAHVVNADGEELERGALHEVLARVQAVHGAGAPKVTALRSLGLDAMDYAETSAGSTHVFVQRMTGEGGGDE